MTFFSQRDNLFSQSILDLNDQSQRQIELRVNDLRNMRLAFFVTCLLNPVATTHVEQESI